MTRCRRVTQLIISLLCCSGLLSASYVAAAPLQRETLNHSSMASTLEQVEITSTPEWVLPQQPKLDAVVPSHNIQDGSYFLLSDFQFYAGDNMPEQQYRHFAVQLTNTNAADNYSQLSFIFAPSYEQLKLHAVTVYRGGQALDKLTGAEHTIERVSASDQVFDGTMQLRLLLSDIRVGDVIDYSYSVIGNNPVFSGHFFHRRPMQWNVPIAQQMLRIVWQSNRPLQLQITPNSDDYHIEQLQRGQQHIYQLALTDTAGVALPDGVPDWYDPRAQLSFSDLATWHDVSRWGQTLFTDAIKPSQTVTDKANDLSAGTTSVPQRMVNALDFVQTQIRYLALEMGVNSHLPAAADMTLRHRFGDCKDKSALLVALLQAMNIKAYPVLVNTDIGERLNRHLPTGRAFNHAIVVVELDGQQIFVDPTIGVQKGALAQRHSPNYGYGLVLADDTESLVKMPASTTAQIDYKEMFDLRRGAGHAASYAVETRYLGGEAEKLRQRLATDGIAGLQQSYQDFFTEQYGDLSAQPLDVDDSDQGLAIRENYQFENPWQVNDKDKHRFFISENQIPLQLPKNRAPRPYALVYPQEVSGEITLKLNDDIDWSFANESQHEQNRFFDYRFDVSFDKDNSELLLNYRYQALAPYVPQQEFNDYLAAIERVADWSEYGIVSYPPAKAVTDTKPVKALGKKVITGLYVLLAIVLLSVAFVCGMVAKKRTRATVFYPTKLSHTVLFMWLTGGIYGVYWCYRNWCYWRKQQDQRQLRWLGLLLPIIYFPLTLQVAQQAKGYQWLLRISAVLTPLAVCALLWWDGQTSLFIGWLVLSLLMTPLVLAVNQLNWQQGIAVPGRWRFYHSLTALALLPGYLWWLAS